jgi:hypothetical protein
VTRTLVYAGGMFFGTMALVQWFGEVRLPGPAEDILRCIVIGQAVFALSMMGLTVHRVASLRYHDQTTRFAASLRLHAVAYFGFALYVAFDMLSRTKEREALSWRTPLAFVAMCFGIASTIRLYNIVQPIADSARKLDAVVQVKIEDVSKPGPDIPLGPQVRENQT